MSPATLAGVRGIGRPDGIDMTESTDRSQCPSTVSFTGLRPGGTEDELLAWRCERDAGHQGLHTSVTLGVDHSVEPLVWDDRPAVVFGFTPETLPPGLL